LDIGLSTYGADAQINAFAIRLTPETISRIIIARRKSGTALLADAAFARDNRVEPGAVRDARRHPHGSRCGGEAHLA
jgi:hypothetical protein